MTRPKPCKSWTQTQVWFWVSQLCFRTGVPNPAPGDLHLQSSASTLSQHTCLELLRKSLISWFRCVWSGLKLNFAGRQISRNRIGYPCFRMSILAMFWESKTVHAFTPDITQPAMLLASSTLSSQLIPVLQVYQVVVIRSGSYDCERVSIERRYSDFLHLHRELLPEFSEEMEDIVMPRKKMTGNFSKENIAARRVALRDYLTQLYSLRCVRKSQSFLAFFTHKELKTSYDLLRGGRFSRAIEGLQKVLVLQEKLSSHNPTLVVPTLCAILVCQRDLEDFDAAFQTGRRALPTVRRYKLRQYQGPLLEALVDLGYSLGLPVAQLQDELTREQDSPNGQVSDMSLKELVVHEFV